MPATYYKRRDIKGREYSSIVSDDTFERIGWVLEFKKEEFTRDYLSGMTQRQLSEKYRNIGKHNVSELAKYLALPYRRGGNGAKDIPQDVSEFLRNVATEQVAHYQSKGTLLSIIDAWKKEAQSFVVQYQLQLDDEEEDDA